MTDKQQPPTTGEYDNPTLYRDAGDGSHERVVAVHLERWNPDTLEWEKWTGAGGVGMTVHGNEYHDPDFEEVGVAAAADAAHVAAGDPHTGYQKESEKNAANGYAGLDASTKLDGSQQKYGSAANTACEGNDARLSDARTPLAHKDSHKHGGSDEVATATPGANVIPKAGADGTLALGFLPATLTGKDADTVDGSHASAFAPASKGVTNGDSHDHVGGDGAPITESVLSLSDVTTGDVSTTKHGFAPKAPNDTSKYLRGDGTWAVPAGGGFVYEGLIL